MKKLLFLGAFALLITSIFSCTAEEYETQTKKETTLSYSNGPGDDPIKVPPPPLK